MEVRQQEAVKGRNISVRDAVSNMSDGIFILVSKWNFGICMDSCVFLGVACIFACMMYDTIGHDPLLFCLINVFLQPHF